jgi:hypothetical protein
MWQALQIIDVFFAILLKSWQIDGHVSKLFWCLNSVKKSAHSVFSPGFFNHNAQLGKLIISKFLDLKIRNKKPKYSFNICHLNSCKINKLGLSRSQGLM